MPFLETWLNKLWYRPNPNRCLWPLTWIYRVIIAIRRYYLVSYVQKKVCVPVIVVGNLSVGGVGKTPLVMALVERFQSMGLVVGVVSRGYKSTIKCFPHEVNVKIDTAEMIGDEAYLIAEKTKARVVIDPNRLVAAQYLSSHCDVIISDDGLQHYRMGRSLEIVVVDGLRQHGNQQCLPAGPLREPLSRLNAVDFIVYNSVSEGDYPYTLAMTPASYWVRVNDGQACPPVQDQRIHAVAAIGHPERFFLTLKRLQISYIPHAFPDHYCFSEAEFASMKGVILMTEKDAVKCRGFAHSSLYFLPAQAELSALFWQDLLAHPVLVPLLNKTKEHS